jgi:hypothetical protein
MSKIKKFFDIKIILIIIIIEICLAEEMYFIV